MYIKPTSNKIINEKINKYKEEIKENKKLKEDHLNSHSEYEKKKEYYYDKANLTNDKKIQKEMRNLGKKAINEYYNKVLKLDKEIDKLNSKLIETELDFNRIKKIVKSISVLKTNEYEIIKPNSIYGYIQINAKENNIQKLIEALNENNIKYEKKRNSIIIS